MYGSKFVDDLEDDYPCEEIIVSRKVLYPESSPRKKEKKVKCYHRSSIENSTPCCMHSNSREEIQPTLLREMEFKPSSTKMKKGTRKRNSRKRDEIYNAEDDCSDPDCSIIYSNTFNVDDQMAEELQPLLGYESKTMDTVNWTESDSSTSVFPTKEKPKRYSSTFNIEKSFDFRDDSAMTELLPNIPSIPRYNLPDTVETKPEPEVLATVLLMSENEDLESTRPTEMFDKLFLDSTAQPTFPTTDTTLRMKAYTEAETLPVEMVSVMKDMDGMENTDQTIEETTIDETSVDVVPDSQISETVQQEELDTTDTTRTFEPPIEWTKNGSEKWTEDDGMLEYVMKAEAASPAYRNYVRLNGSVKPSWFAGYALVSPLMPDCIRITSDPGEALLEAWRLCRPRHFDEFSK